jgi:hypothetical protein
LSAESSKAYSEARSGEAVRRLDDLDPAYLWALNFDRSTYQSWGAPTKPRLRANVVLCVSLWVYEKTSKKRHSSEILTP